MTMLSISVVLQPVAIQPRLSEVRLSQNSLDLAEARQPNGDTLDIDGETDQALIESPLAETVAAMMEGDSYCGMLAGETSDWCCWLRSVGACADVAGTDTSRGMNVGETCNPNLALDLDLESLGSAVDR